MIPSPFIESFNNIKLVIFHETVPLTDTFEQLTLTHDQYIKILSLLETFMPKKGKDSFIVTTNDDFTYKFKDIPAFYKQKDLEV